MKRKISVEEQINPGRQCVKPSGARHTHTETRTPHIRLRGKWLQAAGFPPGAFVDVTIPSWGVIELRLCGTAPAPSKEFSIAAMRLDHAIAADEARKAGAK